MINPYVSLFIGKIVMTNDMIKMYTLNNDKLTHEESIYLYENNTYLLERKFTGYEYNKLPKYTIIDIDKYPIGEDIEFKPDFEYNPKTHNEELEYYYVLKNKLKPDIISFVEEITMLLELKK